MAAKLAYGLLGALIHTAVLLVPLTATGRMDRVVGDGPTAVFLAAATLFYLAELSAMPHAGRRARRPAGRIDRLASRLALAASLAVLAVFWTAMIERATGSPRFAWHQALGGAAMLSGIALRRAAIRGLRERFVTSVTVCDRRPMVEHGLYAWLRHPSEAGLLLIALGAAVLLGSVVAALLWCVVVVPLALLRIHVEDRCLSDAFGKPFQSYRRRVRALVPFVF